MRSRRSHITKDCISVGRLADEKLICERRVLAHYAAFARTLCPLSGENFAEGDNLASGLAR